LTAAGGRGNLWLDTIVLYWVTWMIVYLGLCLGRFHLVESPHQDRFDTPHRMDLEAAFANWDGQWYARIARDGYSYDPDAMSSVAFFPVFPLAGRCVVWITGLGYDLALTLVANAAFFLALVLLRDYTRHRKPQAGPGLAEYAPLALALFPVGFFFRMAYSEAVFLLLGLLVLYALSRHWPILLVAALVGLATAARPVGLALVAPLLLALWRRSAQWRTRLATLAAAGPLCFWGLGAYMGYLYVQFGDPLVFARAQAHWRFRDDSTFAEKLRAVATLEPLWSVYHPSLQAYWRRHDRALSPELSLQFANPIYFIGVVLLIGYGAWQRWLTGEEVLFAAAVLLIGYLTKSYEGCMTSQARFASVAFPVYLVLGRLLAWLPVHLGGAFLALSGFMLGTYAALFAAWYLVI
jgi:hypothetical protein